MKPQIQFIALAPEDFAKLVAENVKACLNDLSTPISDNTPPPAKEFLTRKETAELLGVSLTTIHEWQKNDILKVYKMGNRSYFKYSEVMESLYKSNRV